MIVSTTADDPTFDRKYDMSVSDEDYGSHVTIRIVSVQRKHEEDADFEKERIDISFDVYVEDLAGISRLMEGRMQERDKLDRMGT